MLLEKVRKYVKECRLLEQRDRILLGISGGADSVCLLLVLLSLKEEYQLEVSALHVNHGIRDEEALRDEKFVENLCEKLQVPFFCVHENVPEYASAHGLSEEEAGREIRYGQFRKYLSHLGYTKIAVAHNENDNAETVLHNLFRGCAMQGLCGMQPKSGIIIRPLLDVSRKEIEDFLTEKEQPYVTDSTNLTTEYERNKIRLELLPYIQREINTGAVTHILEMSRKMQEVTAYMDEQTQNATKMVLEKTGDGYGISVTKLQKLPEVLQDGVIYQAIVTACGRKKDITNMHVKQIREILWKTGSKTVSLPYGFCARKEYDLISICKIAEDKAMQLEIPVTLDMSAGEEKSYDLLDGAKVHFTLLTADGLDDRGKLLERNPYTKYLNYDKIKKNVCLRKRKPGDYLTIDRQGHTTSIKKYMINEKIPKYQRDDVWLLAQGNEICWVAGMRLGENLKADEDTIRILKVEYELKEK